MPRPLLMKPCAPAERAIRMSLRDLDADKTTRRIWGCLALILSSRSRLSIPGMFRSMSPKPKETSPDRCSMASCDVAQAMTVSTPNLSRSTEYMAMRKNSSSSTMKTGESVESSICDDMKSSLCVPLHQHARQRPCQLDDWNGKQARHQSNVPG